MKQILTTLAIIISLTSFGQTVDTTVHDCTCVAVNSVNFSHGFPSVTDTVNHIGFFNYTDSPRDTTCVVNYVVKANGNKQNILFNSYTLSKEEYLSWNSDMDLVAIIRNYLSRCGLNLTFK